MKGESDTPVALGRITAHHGLNGWVKVHSDTVPRVNIVRFPVWNLEDRRGKRSIDVLDGREQGKTVVAQLAGITSREQAEPLIGCEISVMRSALPPARKDEFYWTDLIGLDVFDKKGTWFGTVDRLFDTGANDVIVISDRRDGVKPGTEMLVPWVQPDVVVQVSREEGRIVVDWDPDF